MIFLWNKVKAIVNYIVISWLTNWQPCILPLYLHYNNETQLAKIEKKNTEKSQCWLLSGLMTTQKEVCDVVMLTVVLWYVSVALYKMFWCIFWGSTAFAPCQAIAFDYICIACCSLSPREEQWMTACKWNAGLTDAIFISSWKKCIWDLNKGRRKDRKLFELNMDSCMEIMWCDTIKYVKAAELNPHIVKHTASMQILIFNATHSSWIKYSCVQTTNFLAGWTLLSLYFLRSTKANCSQTRIHAISLL